MKALRTLTIRERATGGGGSPSRSYPSPGLCSQLRGCPGGALPPWGARRAALPPAPPAPPSASGFGLPKPVRPGW